MFAIHLVFGTTKAYEKQQSDDPTIRRPKLEAYFEFIELKKIVEATKNWDFFKDVFNIPISGKKGSNKNTAWMDRINVLRRVPGHSYDREYKVEDFEFGESLELPSCLFGFLQRKRAARLSAPR